MRNTKAYKIIVDTYNKLEKLNCTNVVEKDINSEVDYIELECNGLNFKATKFHNDVFDVADNINCEIFIENDSHWYSFHVDWSESKGMLKKISYSREGEFLTNPNKDYKALNLTEISQFMDDLLNQFANDEIRLEQELINDSIPESIEPESEPEQTENIPDITKDQRIELYRFMSDIEDKLYQLYDDNSYYFDSKFTLNNNEITVDNSSNLFISMENIDSYYSISCGIKNKFYTKLTLNKDKLEIIKNDSEISIDEFKELFNQVYYSLDNYFMFKMEALWKKTGNLKDLIKASI